MKKFIPGKVYQTRSVCDHDCLFEITVAKRTEKTLFYIYEGETKKSKIKYADDGEYIRPDNYSMAPVFRASRELIK